MQISFEKQQFQPQGKHDQAMNKSTRTWQTSWGTRKPPQIDIAALKNVNITSSLAMRHQFHQCLHFQNNSMLNDEEKTLAACLEAKFSSPEPEVQVAIAFPGMEIGKQTKPR